MDDTITIKLGPVGYDSSTGVWDEKGRSELVQIFISHKNKINSLQFQYVENGALVLSDRRGTLTRKDKFRVVRLNYPSEYLTCIRGWTTAYHITSITFHTNLRIHGPLGQPGKVEEDEEEFCFELGEDRQFGGFHGSGSYCLSSLGVYVMPMTSLNANSGHVKLENQ